VLSDGTEAMGTHVAISGAALRGLETCGWVEDRGGWAACLGVVQCVASSVSRVDVALDDRSGVVTPERVDAQIKAGGLVSRFHTGRSEEHYGRGGAVVGRTVYIGSPQSRCMVRCYDKAAQLGVPGPWHRVEVQARDERAAALLAALVDGRDIGGVVLALVDFRVPSSDRCVTRWARCSWWGAFVGRVTRAPLRVAARRVQTVQEFRERVMRQWGPSLALLAAVDGEGAVLRVSRAGHVRWGDRHRALAASWGFALT